MLAHAFKFCGGKDSFTWAPWIAILESVSYMHACTHARAHMHAFLHTVPWRASWSLVEPQGSWKPSGFYSEHISLVSDLSWRHWVGHSHLHLFVWWSSSIAQIAKNYIYSSICVFLHKHVWGFGCGTAHVSITGQSVGVSSLFPPQRSRGSNSSRQSYTF